MAAVSGLPMLSTDCFLTDETAALLFTDVTPPLPSDLCFAGLPQGPAVSAVATSSGEPIRAEDRCEKAEVRILNPKRFYDKKQRKHGTGGKVSEQRISDDQVNIAILATLPLADVQVYVQREPEIARKLAAKSPKLYDVGPVQLMTSGLQLSRGSAGSIDAMIEQIVSGGYSYSCSVDLDSVYKTPDGKEIYQLERARGQVNNRFQLITCLQFEDGSHVTLVPYEFILKSGRTLKPHVQGRKDSESQSLSPGSPSSVLTSSDSSEPCSTVFCRHLKAEVAKIKRLEVDEITTTGHDIAYYLKVRPNLLGKFGEGDVVGFFESDAGDTDIDFLTSENSARARMAGVISRSAYVKGKAGASDHDVDLVCIIGEIHVKVTGSVRYGDLIYTSNCDSHPGTAVSQSQLGVMDYKDSSATLIGYAMEGSRDKGVKRVSCLVSIVMGICAQNQQRNMDKLKARVRALEEDLVDIEDSLGAVEVDVIRLKKCWKGCKLKALVTFVVLVLATIVCCLFLAPNSPFLRYMCTRGSMDGDRRRLTFEYTDAESDDKPVTIKGIEFKWSTLQKKLNLDFSKKNRTNIRYYLNYNRCVTGGMRQVASWLDPAPSVPRVNVLAVGSNCSTVYYHSKADNKWVQYQQERAAHIECMP